MRFFRELALSVTLTALSMQAVASTTGVGEPRGTPVSAAFQGDRAAPEPWGSLGLEFGIDWRLLYAIALTESEMVTGKGTSTPWPYTVNSLKYGPRRFDSRQKMVDYLREKIVDERFDLLDVGAMQVNVRWHAYRVSYNVASMADPSVNIRMGAQYLAELMRSSGLQEAVGRYHSKEPETGRKYADRVFKRYRRVMTQFPQPTDIAM